MEKIQYGDLPNCLRLANGDAEVVVSTEFGPRIVGYALAGGANILGLHPHAQVETTLGTWKPYGGHRLWIAPEDMPNSYAPDNAPVEYAAGEQAQHSVRLTALIEAATGMQKEITVTLDARGSGVSVAHKITNCGAETVEFAVWALTIMRSGGEVFIPNEPHAPYGPQTLLPVRNLTCWSYTDFTDERWRFDRDFIRLRVDKNKHEPQKIGVLNKQGWIMYRAADLEFVKRFEHVENAVYPDMNSNTEIYAAGSFIEIETLAPLRRVAPGKQAEHVERWELKSVA